MSWVCFFPVGKILFIGSGDALLLLLSHTGRQKCAGWGQICVRWHSFDLNMQVVVWNFNRILYVWQRFLQLFYICSVWCDRTNLLVRWPWSWKTICASQAWTRHVKLEKASHQESTFLFPGTLQSADQFLNLKLANVQNLGKPPIPQSFAENNGSFISNVQCETTELDIIERVFPFFSFLAASGISMLLWFCPIHCLEVSVNDPDRYPHLLSVKNCFIRGHSHLFFAPSNPLHQSQKSGSVVRYVHLPAHEAIRLLWKVTYFKVPPWLKHNFRFLGYVKLCVLKQAAFEEPRAWKAEILVVHGCQHVITRWTLSHCRIAVAEKRNRWDASKANLDFFYSSRPILLRWKTELSCVWGEMICPFPAEWDAPQQSASTKKRSWWHQRHATSNFTCHHDFGEWKGLHILSCTLIWGSF